MKIYLRACVCLHNKDNNVLFVCENEDPYWILPGGGVEENESAIQAVSRELKEELALDISVDELDFLKVIENFYSINGESIHEINFLFKATVEEELSISFEEGVERRIVWLPIEQLNSLDLMPSVLLEAISDNKNLYLVSRD